MTTQTEILRLFTNQFLDHEGNPNGVHLGCDDLEVCKQSHVPGEISTVIHEWVDAAELRRIVAQRDALLDAAKEAEPMLQAMLDNIRKTLPQYTKMPALDKLSAAIKAVED